MNNSCYNLITIYGAADVLKSFRDECLIDGCFNFNSVVPRPTCFKPGMNEIEMVRCIEITGGYSNLNDWCKAKWGTGDKGAYNSAKFLQDLIPHGIDQEYFFGFLTDWSPCNLNFTQSMAIRFPKVNFRWVFYVPATHLAGDYLYNRVDVFEHFYPYGTNQYKDVKKMFEKVNVLLTDAV